MSAFDPTPDARERVLAERGATLVAAAVAGTRASLGLRERLAADRAAARRSRPPLSRRLALPLGGVAACVALALVLFGGASGPTVAEVAAVGARPATAPAPQVVGDTIPWLDAAVDGVAFPDWRETLDWPATGRRDDRVDGRSTTTIAYETVTGDSVAYTIVAGEALDPPDGAREVRRGDTTYRLLESGGRKLVTWERSGRTCVLSAPASLPDAKLVEAAGWQGT